MASLKRLAVRSLTAPGMRHLFWPLLKHRASVFMLHRFRMPDVGVEGHDPAELDRLLAEFRRRRYDLIDLEALFRALADGREFPRPTVAFTIDDGYADQAEVAAPVFAKHGCPATTFVTSGFLDGRLWFWWDRIEFALRHTPRRALEISIGDRRLRYEWHTDGARDAAQADLTAHCKQVPDDEKHAAIERLAAALDVHLPATPPPAYRPMSWDDLRRCEHSGMRFGPHTVTHPVLSRTTDEQSRNELEEGWARLRAEARAALPVFCYPNGQAADFGPREMDTLKSLGFLGAVVGEAGYANSVSFRRDGDQPFLVRRFSYIEDIGTMLQAASGVERAKQLMRREA